ncbi:hypothetical protein BCR36DRAFT_581012 [Piromyces finnis]|uniref:Protein NO VEIN C-terminal domain-containing protein n=1 Tax=Piromyces finnis TaxID=1754191 RepID=A0A1Y1VGK2_9FUNG|nr:hypothetical protein BCR36DRAFT_581012 [Piromyces finnis]|eukprot:ORX55846.1 hypothetical protein BCR36DRAFT_581012 [Piromyces finnis]
MNSSSNPFDSERKKIFGKIYLANVRNRLRELKNPNDIDCQRSCWELVQNAKDSIAGTDRKSVDIKIHVDENTFIFKHNGSPFVISTLTALIYKYSEGKTNDGESTGRFGTGFLTTHCLSFNVKITSDIITDGKVKGFEVTMFRDGEDDELLEGLQRTEDSYKEYESCNGWTSYEFKMTTKRNKEACRLAIENFKDNIAKVMLFCPEINSIELDDNGKVLSINRLDTIYNRNYSCYKSIFEVNDNNQSGKKTFIYNNVDEHNELLTKKFKKSRNLRINCAIELDENNNIVVDESSPCLFCSLPLVGSESHILPCIINSPDFEPDAERQALLLDGSETDDKTGKISDPGVNKMILERVQDMYEKLLKYICDSGIKNRYLLARGLQSIPSVTRFFNRKWYSDNFIKPMRDILIKYPVVWNGIRYIELTNVYFPITNNIYSNRKEAYGYISKIYNNVVPTYEESINFNKYIWLGDERISYVDIEESVKRVESFKNMTSLKINCNIQNEWEWIDDFLSYIKSNCPTYLEQYKIIPNMNGEYVKLTNELSGTFKVPDNIIECLEEIGVSWKVIHLHKKLIKYSTGSEHSQDYAISKIQNRCREWSENILKVLHYIPYSEEKEFIEKYSLIFDICSVIFKNDMKTKKDGTGFPKYLYEGIDNIVFKKICTEIKKNSKVGGIYTIEFINKVLGCLSIYYSSYTEYEIIPNQNNKFCKYYDLSKDNNIPDLFKECLVKCLDKDIKNNLMHKDITPIKPFYEKNIYNYEYTLKEFFEKPEKGYDRYSLIERKKKAACYLIRIIPKVNVNNRDINDDYNYNFMDFQNNQRVLFNLYKKIFKNFSLNSCEIERNDKNEGIWKYSNKYIYKEIKEIIESKNTISKLSTYIGESEKETLKYLKCFINFTNEGKIIPNQNNEFCKISDLCNDGSFEKDETDKTDYYFNKTKKKLVTIPNKLKEISKLLGYDVKENLIHGEFERLCLRDISYQEICTKIDNMMKEEYVPENYFNQNFKNACRYLIEDYFDTIDEKCIEQYFPNTYKNKDNIVLSVLFNKETRKQLTNLKSQYSEEELKKLNSPEKAEIVKIVLENEITIEQINKTMSESKSSLFSNSSTFTFSNTNGNGSYLINSTFERCVNIKFSSSIINDKELNSFYTDTFKNVMKYGDDFDFGNPINKRTGNCGEAYIYELLLNSNKFKKVEWKMLSKSVYSEVLEYRGKRYNIVNDGSHYDIYVETFDGKKIYIEVKSTTGSFGNKIPFYISKYQIDMMRETRSPDQYILALVFDVMGREPKHFFMKLIDDLIENH